MKFIFFLEKYVKDRFSLNNVKFCHEVVVTLMINIQT